MKGFTLIETLVAVTILTLSIVAPMTTANRAIVAAETARDQLSASYLAQEGIEYMRAVRDDEFLATYPSNTTNAWPNFLNTSTLTPCRSPGICTLGPLQSGILCQSPGCTSAPFSLGTTATKFTRTIQMTARTGTDELITSKVSWTFHSTTYSVTITDHLTPWQ